MKWVGLIITLAAIVPLSVWLRRNPNESPKIWILIGFLPFAIAPFHLYMAVISWAEWPGYVKGIEFSVLDALALALYVNLPGGRVPFRLPMILYFLAVLLATLHARFPEAAIFYLWQLARMFLIYSVVTRGCADPRVVRALLQGMAAALFMEAGLAIWQRFALGILQSYGTLDHQNLLGLMSHLIVFPFFALLLARPLSWLPAAVSVTGIVVEVLTTSRATVGLALFGYIVVFVLSAFRQWTTRKALVLFLGAAVVVIAVPVALLSFESRFAAEGSSEYDERAAFEIAAGMMLADHPWGIGPNNYVLVANIDGYNAKAGVAPVAGSGGANVHNVYLLVAAESGYVGLIVFIVLILNPLIVAFRCGLRHRKDQRGDLLIGLAVALLVVYIHSLFEWVFITFQFQYMFALELGLIAGLAQQLGYWRRANRHGVGLRAQTFSARPSGGIQGVSR